MMKVKPHPKCKNDRDMLLMICLFKELLFESLAKAFMLKAKPKCRNWVKVDESRVSDLRTP